MKTLLLTSSLLLSLSSFAKDSVTDTNSGIKTKGFDVDAHKIRHHTYNINNAIEKLKALFTNDKEKLKTLFPEVNIEDLLKKMKDTKIIVVNEVLKDKSGATRTCLNYADLSIIKCSVIDLDESFYDYQEALHVLMLHQYLGLMGINENSKINVNTKLNSAYSISKRLTPYLNIPVAYDFSFDKKNLSGFENTMGQIVFESTLERRYLYPSKKELIKQSLKFVETQCTYQGKKVTFMDARAENIERNNKVACEGVVTCFSTTAMIHARFICD